MWRKYLGESSEVWGIDIEPACRIYEAQGIRIVTGDQGDRSFWKRFKSEVKSVDILIDDGGHTYQQQRVTLEEMLPHLNAGGVYICEDIHGTDNQFLAYLHGVNMILHHFHGEARSFDEPIFNKTNSLQMMIDSIHFYPYVAVIKKREHPTPELISRKKGSIWQPFL